MEQDDENIKRHVDIGEVVERRIYEKLKRWIKINGVCIDHVDNSSKKSLKNSYLYSKSLNFPNHETSSSKRGSSHMFKTTHRGGLP